jgi:hypothetical protein
MNSLRPNGESPNVERGVTKGSNEKFSGASNKGSTAAMGHQSASFSPSNNSWSALAAKRGSSAPMGQSSSPVRTDDHRFKIGDARMPQPQSAVEPGKGMVPVNPFQASGKPSKVSYMKNAKK